LPEQENSNSNKVVPAVKRWLQSNADWLLIFDNVSDMKAVLELLPTREMGHILLTTRSQISGENIKNIEVKKMEPEEGMLFLLRTTIGTTCYSTRVYEKLSLLGCYYLVA